MDIELIIIGDAVERVPRINYVDQRKGVEESDYDPDDNEYSTYRVYPEEAICYSSICVYLGNTEAIPRLELHCAVYDSAARLVDKEIYVCKNLCNGFAGEAATRKDIYKKVSGFYEPIKSCHSEEYLEAVDDGFYGMIVKIEKAVAFFENGEQIEIPESKLRYMENEKEVRESGVYVRKSGGCYIATCVYGSYDCPQVWTLRRYRDTSLAKTWYGRTFVRCYYAISPSLVKWFGKTKWFQKLWRGKLDKKVAKLQANGFSSLPYQDM